MLVDMREYSLRIHCDQSAGAGVTALAGSVLLNIKGVEAASFFLDEVPNWGAEMNAVLDYMLPRPKSDTANVAHVHRSTAIQTSGI